MLRAVILFFLMSSGYAQEGVLGDRFLFSIEKQPYLMSELEGYLLVKSVASREKVVEIGAANWRKALEEYIEDTVRYRDAHRRSREDMLVDPKQLAVVVHTIQSQHREIQLRLAMTADDIRGYLQRYLTMKKGEEINKGMLLKRKEVDVVRSEDFHIFKKINLRVFLETQNTKKSRKPQ